MKILAAWLLEFANIKADDRSLAEALTLAGVAVESVSGEGADTVFEMEITTNRPDAMNHYGVAREASAIYDLELKSIHPQLPPARGQANFKIEITAPELCGRYTARIIRGIEIAPSPQKIAARLAALDQRPINNVADATNYALQEMGHPTHAFDLDLLEGGRIIVRRAATGETLKTLDGIDRKLSPDDLVIADAKKPVALAGVMGGYDSMITEKTKNVLIESAWFDPVAIRQSSRRHGLHTDASHRFERGADWGATSLACARVAELILHSAGGQLEGGEIDAVSRRLERPPVPLRRSEIVRILGHDVPEQEVLRILRRLGFAITPGRAVASAAAMQRAARPAINPTGIGGAHAAVAEPVMDFSIQLPTWRLDVEREIDLIEEVARVYGFNRFPGTLPAFSGAVVELPEAARDAALRSSLLALGYNEAISLTFISGADAQIFSAAAPVEIANPISDEARFMRNSMLPGMLDMLAWNLNRGTLDVRLFESGNIFEAVAGRALERRQVSLGVTGNVSAPSVHLRPPSRPYSFFDLKGDVETLLAHFQHGAFYFDPHTPAYYHSGRSARALMEGATVACFGLLHPETAAARKLRPEIYIAELFLDRLYAHPLRQPRYQPISRFPAVERDFSFLFAAGVSFEKISAGISALRIGELRSFRPVEIFRGGAIPTGEYSLLLRATFQSTDRTLRDDEVALWSTQIIKALQALGGTLRA